MQITLVPNLLAAAQSSELRAPALLMLREVIQQYPFSTVSFLNMLGYAVLAIPCVIFGLLLLNHQAQARLAGGLLVVHGVASILGLVGALLRAPLFSFGTVMAAVLFLLALVPLAVAFLTIEGASRPALHLQPRLRLR
jgi:hypothetical protein